VSAARAADLLGLHRQNNRESAELWQRFAPHRERVTALALAGDPAGGSLAVLGAGNANDLDLEALAARFDEIHLVDLDAEALERARRRQAPGVAARLVLHAGVDLSGAFDRLSAFGATPATPAELAGLPGRSVERVRAALPRTFDRVVSTCFLSQLLQSAFVALGPRHPQLQIIACALAVAHVRSVVGLLAPGGVGCLVTDAVSTETYPIDELWESQPPFVLLESLEKAGNVFSGTGPAFLRRILATDKDVAPTLRGPARVVEPWRWAFTDERTYLVYALSFTRA
jgi:hypothetical protein